MTLVTAPALHVAGTPDDALSNPPRVSAGVHKYVPMASKFSKLGGIRLRFPSREGCVTADCPGAAR